MKKALSLALVVVMMLSLAPMTAMAATGTKDDPVALAVDGTENVCTVEENGHFWYTFQSETEGTLTIEPVGDDVWLEFYQGAINMNGYAGQADFPVGADNPYTFAISANTQYFIDAKTSSTGSGTVSFIATFEEGAASEGDTMDTAINVTGQSSLSVPAKSTKYFYVTGSYYYGNEYTLSVDGGKAAAMGNGITVTSFMNEQQVATATEQAQASILAIGMMANGGSVYFSVTNPSSYDYTAVSFTVTEGAPGTGGLGSESEPDELNLGSYNSVSVDGNEYWYKWTAPAAGKFTLTLENNLCSSGWTYKVFDGEDYEVPVQHRSTGWDESDKNVCEVVVEKDDVVLVALSVPFYYEQHNAYDPYLFASGDVYYSASFVEGDFSNTEEGDDLEKDDKDPTEGVITGGDENYAESTAPIIVGENTLTVSNMYAYTVFLFEPTEIGTYTLTSEDSVMGIVGYSSAAGVLIAPSSETVASKTITMECSSVGQEILLAVKADTNVANIKVTKEDLNVVEIPSRNAVVSSEAYVFTGNVADLTYVDVEDKIVDKAVYASDGYYHLNSADGPILLVNLDDSVMSFVIDNSDMTDMTFGSVTVSYYDGDEIAYSVSYADALNTYIANSDKFTHSEYGDMALYPLTYELIEIYNRYGTQQKWYESTDSSTGYVIGQFKNANPEDIWMFACLYVPNAEDGTIVVPPVAIKPEVDEKGNVTNTEITESVIEAKIEQAVAENKPLVVETTEEGVVLTFAVEDLKNAEAVKLNVAVAIKEDVNDETVAKNDKITEDNFVLKIEFSHDGKLPAKATITIPVPAKFAGETLYYYEILADGTLKYECDAPVDANGVAKVTQDHCSDYVLLTEKIAETTGTTGTVAPGGTTTGDATNIALWVAVLGLGVVAIAGSVVMKKRKF